jgi:uncharacterized protein
MNFIIGFLIAAALGLTGIGGGGFAVPALMLLVGLTAGEAVGTAFLFPGVLRLVTAPFYLWGGRFIRVTCGFGPGSSSGSWWDVNASSIGSRRAWNPFVIILLGVLLAVSSSVTFVRRVQPAGVAGRNHRSLPWLALPIGVESGFLSAGVGTLGTALLLNYPEMTPPQVVGTDLLFGLVLTVIGSAFHWSFGSINSPVLLQ